MAVCNPMDTREVSDEVLDNIIEQVINETADELVNDMINEIDNEVSDEVTKGVLKMSEWKEFTGSKQQLDEIENAKNGWTVRTKYGYETPVFTGKFVLDDIFINDVSEYLICEPHPLEEQISRWIKTGQPVYCFSQDMGWYQVKGDPSWMCGVKYSFNPPPNKVREFIEVRDYLWRDIAGNIQKSTIYKGISSPANLIEENTLFVKWLDNDWKRIDV